MNGHAAPLATASYSRHQQQVMMDPSGLKMQQDQQTIMWAQQNYFLDSGIQSAAAPTAASSVLSGFSGTSGMIEEHMDNVYGAPSNAGSYSAMPGYSGYTQDQVNGFNNDYDASRSYRIRAAMFPETLHEPIASAPYDVGQSTNVQRLTEPGQMLKMAVVNIVNYQEDAALTKKVIPELVELLSDQDKVVVQKAAQFVHYISKNDAMSSVLAGEQDLLKRLVSLTNSPDSHTVKYAVGTLYNLSNAGEGRLAIFHSGGIEALIRLLDSPVDAVVNYAITTLHNLILHQNGAQDSVRRYGGVAKMVNLLKTKNLEKFLAILTDCLYNLSLNSSETKLEILRAGGTNQLITILNNYNYEKLFWTTGRLMQALSICPDNKRTMVANGGLQALARHLAHPSHRLVRTLLLVIRNLSDAAVQCEQVEQLLIGILKLMGSSDVEVVLCCAGILSNLSCNNIRNKATIHRNNGINYLLRTTETYEPVVHTNPVVIADILESCLCTLRHVTTRHQEADQAQNDVRLYRSMSAPGLNGLQLIARFVNPAAQWPLTLVRPALGLIRNVAYLPANAQPLYDLGVVKNVCTLLTRFYSHLQQAQRSNVQPTLIDGIKCVDMVDACVSVLQMLCKFEPNRVYVRQANVVPILVQLLYFDTDTVQQFAAGTLTEMVAEQEGCQLIEQNGAVPQLTELLHSRNDKIATYAAAVLHALSQTKPPEYQEHLGVELTSSLFRDDSTPWGQDVLNDMPQVNEDVFDTYNGGFVDPSNYSSYGGAGSLLDYDTMTSTGTAPPQYSASGTPYYAGGAPVHHQGPPLGAPPMFPQQHHQQQQQQAGPQDWYDTNL